MPCFVMQVENSVGALGNQVLAGKQKRSVTCSVCKKPGHNKKTCFNDKNATNGSNANAVMRWVPALQNRGESSTRENGRTAQEGHAREEDESDSDDEEVQAERLAHFDRFIAGGNLVAAVLVGVKCTQHAIEPLPTSIARA